MEELKRLIRRDWPYLILLAFLFVMSVALGVYLPQNNPEMAEKLTKVAVEKFSQIARLMKNASVWVQILIIFGNNLGASLMAIMFGLLIPVIPLFFLFSNGILIGLFQNVLAAEAGLSPLDFYLSLIPHGIFELPAFFIAVGLGIRFGLIPYRLVWTYYRTKKYLPLFSGFMKELRYYSVLVIVMLIIAAVIEVTVSPLLLK